MKEIICEENKREHQDKIPAEPEPEVPVRQRTGVLGKQTHFVKSLDKKYIVDRDAFKMNALRTKNSREERGEGSMHSVLQPWRRPELPELINQRIDIFVIKVNQLV